MFGISSSDSIVRSSRTGECRTKADMEHQAAPSHVIFNILILYAI